MWLMNNEELWDVRLEINKMVEFNNPSKKARVK
jgi:hypothetical protein